MEQFSKSESEGGEEATTDARKLPSQRNERGEKADSDKITNQFVVT